MVGAPLSNVTGYDGSQLIKYGAVYRCEYTGLQECKVITTDNRRKYKLNYRYYFSSQQGKIFSKLLMFTLKKYWAFWESMVA